MIDKELILDFVNENGPVLPRDIVKEYGGDTFLVGALLSQLVDNNQLKLSKAKIGGSPVYYLVGQEERLQTLYTHLHEKEKKAYDKLKEKKILMDIQTDPVTRVALRNIKDFAKALEVSIKGRRELFWKWYLLPNADAETIIKQMLRVSPKREKKVESNLVKKEPLEQKDTQQSLIPEHKEQTSLKNGQHNLLSNIQQVFSEKGINIFETSIIRKNSEIDMVIHVPSSVGNLKYYCKIRNKKKCNDKDLSSAYVQGELRKLPVLFITTGELTKKAKLMLEREFSKVSLMQI